MAKNISLLGAQYSDVPGVTLPQTGGGTATFYDIDDTTATASDVLSGKYFYDDDGIKTQGSISNGTITNNTSGGTSSGTINRGSQIKIGAGYYANDAYYTAQENNGTKNITSSGTTSVDGYLNAYVEGGTITNNTSGGTSSGTVNRGSQIKIGRGYYASDAYYTAQANSGTKNITSSGTTSVDGYANVSVSAGTITNNTSGGTSSGTINRGSQIKIGAGFYASDAYYQAQSNSGTLTITQSGTTSCNGYANVDVPKGAIVVSVSASSNTSTTINNSNITANHYVYNTSFVGAAADISWSTAAGSITVSCSGGIPAMTLMLCLNM